ncbi:ATP-binding protein [Streptomyces sp. NPDC059649]|uniref:ATP-binding protein n=1 Tax=Streptomyces sp. NPDC059649 TaxID=3346895 RepID=UPI0036886F3B
MTAFQQVRVRIALGFASLALASGGLGGGVVVAADDGEATTQQPTTEVSRSARAGDKQTTGRACRTQTGSGSSNGSSERTTPATCDAGGAGLGLAIVRDVVLRHAGTISNDEADGSGARFTVTLPAAPTADPAG